MTGACGLIAIEASAAEFTVKVADALTEPELIPMVVVPGLSVVASPCVPDASLIVATPASVELQWADCVAS
jgi:hypothetical protein